MSYLDSFTIDAFDVDRTYGFAPGAAIVWSHSNTSTTDNIAAADQRLSFGVIASSGQAVTSAAYDNADQFNRPSSNGSTSKLVLSNLGTTGVIDGSAGGSFLADGIRFNLNNFFDNPNRVHTLAIPASRIASSAVGQLSAPSGAGSVGVTIGFSADVVLFFRQFTVATTGEFLSIGAASRAGAVSNVCSVYYSRYISGDPSDTEGYSRSGESLIGASSTTSGSVTSWSATGFTTTWSGGAGEAFTYLALKAAPGFAFDLAKGTTRTDGSAFTVPFRRVKPDSGLVVSCCRAESAAGTRTAPARISIGAFAPAGTSTQLSAGLYSADNSTFSSVRGAVDYDSVYANVAAGSNSLDGEMTLSSSGILHSAFAMSNADPSESFFWVLASGTAASRPRGSPIFF